MHCIKCLRYAQRSPFSLVVLEGRGKRKGIYTHTHTHTQADKKIEAHAVIPSCQSASRFQARSMLNAQCPMPSQAPHTPHRRRLGVIGQAPWTFARRDARTPEEDFPVIALDSPAFGPCALSTVAKLSPKFQQSPATLAGSLCLVTTVAHPAPGWRTW